jgi:hypothetical protein
MPTDSHDEYLVTTPEQMRREIEKLEARRDDALKRAAVDDELILGLKKALAISERATQSRPPDELKGLELIDAIVMVLEGLPPGPVKIKDTLLPILLERGAHTGQRKQNKKPLSEADNPWKAVRVACSTNPTYVIYNKADDTVKLPRAR